MVDFRNCATVSAHFRAEQNHRTESRALQFRLRAVDDQAARFRGKTEFWEHNMESFTLMAGLAAVTSKIQLYATAATLVMPPAIVARMAATIDSISNGRFGVNVVTGWQKPEYEQMGMWPGDDYFGRRYDYLTEYVTVLRDLWGTGHCDLNGEFFKMDDCRVSPRPKAEMKVICAGQSDAGMAFSAKHADYNFCFGKGVNTPTAFAPTAARMKTAADAEQRSVASYVLFMVIADENEAAARAKWDSYKAGADSEALAWLTDQSTKDTKSGADTNVRQMADPTSAVNINMGTLVGSYASVANMLDEIASVPGTEGVLLTFDDFVQGIENFGQFIQPLMKTRQHLLSDTSAEKEVA
ncbi:pyrimidine utilization protein A [Rouxiella chamberiensis]|uniref:Pyrimidine utilization protein A n=1 Tax=Rouxiella chamberiensis TaxID=1513468 RepID=A0ABY7HUG4_9GAMM|nr:pyrimidine utilization protein A [Rouxiella chamberiensis]WAT03063.1 pyrimidine utilization protein A [Rouxiella chamberiensis]